MTHKLTFDADNTEQLREDLLDHVRGELIDHGVDPEVVEVSKFRFGVTGTIDVSLRTIK